MATSIRGNTVKREGNARIRSRNGAPVYECQYSYIVEATTVDEDYMDVISTPGLPVVGVTAEPSGFAVCTGVVATRRIENPKIWDVVADFSSDIDDSSGSGGDPSSDPETWIPLYETKFERYQEPLIVDFSGNPVVNTAGQKFQNQLIRTRFIPMWDLFQLESATVTDTTVLGRTEVVNSGTFKGRAAKTLLCTVVSSVIGRYYGQLRRLTRYQLRYKQETWKVKRLSTGTAYMPTTGTKLVPFEGGIEGGLDEFGFAVDAGQPPHVLEFDVFQSVSFSFLRV